MDLDTAGAAATAGLASAAIEKRTGKAGEAHSHCPDCGAALVGRFCHDCGQPAHTHRSLLHLGEELLHGVMHFDGRVFRALPLLLFRPGRLTREWVHGKRTRYVSPLAMFLFTAFLTFMVLSLLPKSAEDKATLQDAIGKATAGAQEEAAAVEKLEAALGVAPPDKRASVEADLAEARDDLARKQRQAETLTALQASGVEQDWKKALEKQTGRKMQIITGWHALDEKLAHAIENPELAWYKLKNSFYKFSFLLVPLSIPFVALLFVWKRGFTLYDHGVFVLYSLTFVSLYILATAVLGSVAEPLGVLAGGLFPFLVPTHMYYQLQGAYGLRTFSTLWRLWLLLFFCSIVSLLFLMLVAYIGL
ncbi:DUF3667 domain-containing protein [Phenylobacterium sp.]|jgi:hypothetical protein|uniref:DUF3667 domain-containing protein n=1 Tax=Phenylobacterium sp. TaxID=1871053 RepID=UPI002F92612D